MRQLTLKEVKAISGELDTVLKQFAAKHGLDVKTGNIGYSEDSFKVRGVTFNVQLSDKEKKIAEKNDFKDLCRYYGLEANDYGRNFDYNGKSYKVVGFMPRKRKYSVRCIENKTGAVVGFTEDAVKNFLH